MGTDERASILPQPAVRGGRANNGRRRFGPLYCDWVEREGGRFRPLGRRPSRRGPGGCLPAPEQQGIRLLEFDAPKADKPIRCKRLAIWESGKAVPALAALSPDAELTWWARIALGAIPDPAADRALRGAMATLEGGGLIGVVDPIGLRRDP